MPLPDPDPSISSFAAIPANELERFKQAAAPGDSDEYQTDRQAATLHNAEKWAQTALQNGAGADINELLQNIRAAKAR